jgi:pimeloyl-ACP methyl ester carboxylesterase
MLFSVATLVLVIGVGGVVLCAGAAVLMGWSLTHPPRMSDGKAMWVLKRLSPSDLGLEFEDVTFVVRDERGEKLSIAAWWIPHPRAEGRCVVLQHGYADAKVGAIAWAPVWHSLGINVLTADMRAHGESGGRACTAGFFEREDLSQVIDELRSTRPEQTRVLALAGLSMGAAVAAATAAKRDDVAAVVLDSVYARFQNAARRHMSWVGLPGGWIQLLAVKLAGWMTGADLDSINPTELIASMKCPAMVIEAGKDWSLSAEDRAALKEAVEKNREKSGAAELWTVEDTGHLMALVADAGAYRAKLGNFLSTALKCNVASALEPAGAPSPGPNRTTDVVS